MADIFVQDIQSGQRKTLRELAAINGAPDEQTMLEYIKSQGSAYKILNDPTPAQAPVAQAPGRFDFPEASNSPAASTGRPMNVQISSAAKSGAASGARDLDKALNPVVSLIDKVIGQGGKKVDQSMGSARPPRNTGPVLRSGIPTVDPKSPRRSEVARQSTAAVIAKQREQEKAKVAELEADSAQDTGLLPSVVRGAARTPFDLARYAPATALGLPLPVAMGVTEAITNAEDGGEAALKAGVEGGVTGLGMKWGGDLARGMMSPALESWQKANPGVWQNLFSALGMGTGGATANATMRTITGEEAPEGTFTTEAATQGILGALLHNAPRISGRVNAELNKPSGMKPAPRAGEAPSPSPLSAKANTAPVPPSMPVGVVKPVDAPLGLGGVQFKVNGQNFKKVLESGQTAFEHKGQTYGVKEIKTPQGPQVEIRNLATKETKTVPMGNGIKATIEQHFGAPVDTSRPGSALSRGLKNVGSKAILRSMKFNDSNTENTRFKKADLAKRAAETGNAIGVPEGTGDAQRRYEDAAAGLKKASEIAEAKGVTLDATVINDGIKEAMRELIGKNKEADVKSAIEDITSKHGILFENGVQIKPTEAEKLKSILNKELEDFQNSSPTGTVTSADSAKNIAYKTILDGIRKAQAATIDEPVRVYKKDGQYEELPYREAARLTGLDKSIKDISEGLEGQMGGAKATVEAARAATAFSPYRGLTLFDKLLFTPERESRFGTTLYKLGKKLESTQPTTPPPISQLSLPPTSTPPGAPQGPIAPPVHPLAPQPSALHPLANIQTTPGQHPLGGNPLPQAPGIRPTAAPSAHPLTANAEKPHPLSQGPATAPTSRPLAPAPTSEDVQPQGPGTALIPKVYDMEVVQPQAVSAQPPRFTASPEGVTDSAPSGSTLVRQTGSVDPTAQKTLPPPGSEPPRSKGAVVTKGETVTQYKDPRKGGGVITSKSGEPYPVERKAEPKPLSAKAPEPAKEAATPAPKPAEKLVVPIESKKKEPAIIKAAKGPKSESKPKSAPPKEAPKPKTQAAKAGGATPERPTVATAKPPTSGRTGATDTGTGSTPKGSGISTKSKGDGSHEIIKNGKRVGSIEKVGDSWQIYRDAPPKTFTDEFLAEVKQKTKGKAIDPEVIAEIAKHFKD